MWHQGWAALGLVAACCLSACSPTSAVVGPGSGEADTPESADAATDAAIATDLLADGADGGSDAATEAQDAAPDLPLVSFVCSGDDDCHGVETGPCRVAVCSPAGVCVLQPAAANSPCDDGNPCTTDGCGDGACVGVAKAEGAACSDGTACTSGDVCQGGSCHGSAISCDDGQPCTDDTCDGLSGACLHLPNSAGCDDGDACTSADQCALGVCAGTLQACSDGIACTDDECSQGACVHLPTAGACVDGNACTVGETCQSGECAGGTLLPCDDGHPCTTDACDPVYGCVHTSVAKGTSCGQGQWCMNDGSCVPAQPCEGMPALCDDHESCTLDFCDDSAGCIHIPSKDGTHCDDDDACTPMVGDKCNGGVCSNPVNLCGCTQDADCVKFDDGNLCNGLSRCLDTPSGKKCKPAPGTVVECPAPPQGSCKVAFCQPDSGKCLVQAAPEGSWCRDGDACTTSSVCAGGTCTAVSSQSCDDANPCTTDTCDAKLGCGHTSIAGCVPPGCTVTTCDDGDPCTTDTCAGAGCSHAPVDCSPPGNPCLTGACIKTGAKTYACDVHPVPSQPPLAVPLGCAAAGPPGQCPAGYVCIAPDDQASSGTCQPTATVACSDGDACTVGDSCDAGICHAGAPLGCDDDDPCTEDACGKAGCLHTPITGCAVCLSEHFESGAPQDVVTWSENDKYVSWSVGPGLDGNHVFRSSWKGPLAGSVGKVLGWSFLKRLYFAPGVTPRLDFRYRTQFGAVTCGSDDVAVYANGALLWRECDSTPGGFPGTWKHATVDLSAWTGAPVDLDIRAYAGAESQAFGTVEIDDLRVTGACTTACVGGDFETRSDARVLPSSIVPQAWLFKSSDPTFAGWERTQTGGHTGVGAYSIHYSGKPVGGAPVSATFTMPQILASAGSQLRYASRVLVAADGSCGADDLIVRVGDKVVDQACKAQGIWTTHSIDLSPWADKDVDVTFEVKTGAGATTEGFFQLDDIAVTGACSYACFRSDFEEASGIEGYWHGETPQTPAWSVMSDAAVSGTHSVGVTFPETLPAGSLATLMFEDKWRWVMPVLGATMTLHGRLDASNSTCNTEQLRIRMAWQYRGIAPTSPQEAIESPYLLDVAGLCQDTKGWQAIAIELGGDLRMHKFLPYFELEKPQGAGKASTRLDDVLVRCR